MKNLCLIFLYCLLTTCQTENSFEPKDATSKMTSDEVLQTLGQIYVYGYPLSLSDLTKKGITSNERPLQIDLWLP